MARTIAILVLLAAAPASANCTPGLLDLRYAWPRDQTGVPTNTRVLVHVYGSDAYLAQPLALELRPASGPAIALRIVLDVHSGSSAMQQRSVLLEPASELAPSTAYTLADVGPTPDGAQPASFTTGTARDTTAPTRAVASRLRFERFEWGCGPSENIEIRVDATDDSPIAWLRLHVAHNEADLRAGRFLGETILIVDHGVARFGHEMCIGSWPLDPGQRFVASASLIDPALHEVPAGIVVLDASSP